MRFNLRYIVVTITVVFVLCLQISCVGKVPTVTSSAGEISEQASGNFSAGTENLSLADSSVDMNSSGSGDIASDVFLIDSASQSQASLLSSHSHMSDISAPSSSSSGAISDNEPDFNEKLNEVGFGYYGVGQYNMDIYNMVLDADHVNVMFAGCVGISIEEIVDEVRTMKEHGKTCWLHVHYQTFVRKGERTELRSDYRSNLIKLTEALTNAGVYDCVRGIYLDEPLLQRISKEDLYEMTRFYRLLNKNKRVFICFAVSAICPDIWTPDFHTDRLDEESSAYITDIAFDMYWNYSGHEHIYSKLANKMYEITRNNPDTKYWFVPMTMNTAGKIDEQTSIEHTNGMYELMKKSPNPGGLMCYSYYTYPSEVEALGHINLDILFDKNNPDRWEYLEHRLKTIGDEIVSGSWKK